MKTPFRFAIPLFVLLWPSLAAHAATLYKLTDRAGKVTYSQSVPRGFDGKVTPMQIDATQPAPETKPAAHAESEYEKIIRRRPPPDKKEAALEAARAKVEAARKEYQNARDNSTPADWIYYGGRPVTGIGHRGRSTSNGSIG